MLDDTHCLDIVPAVAAPMRLRVALPGQANHLVAPSIQAQNEPHVEFYDRSFMDEPGFPPYGQLICSLSVTALLNRPSLTALVLNSRVPQWWVDAGTMEQVRAWLSTQRAAIQ